MDAIALVSAVTTLSRSHSHAPPLDGFDLGIRDRSDQVLDFAGRADRGTAFGQLFAIAFDPWVTPLEWAAFAGLAADQSIRNGGMQIWRTHAVPRSALHTQ